MSMPASGGNLRAMARLRYDNPAAELRAAKLSQAVGERPAPFARREPFAPLGIEASGCARDDRAKHLGFSGLKLRTRDIGRIGRPTLQRGRVIADSSDALPASAPRNQAVDPIRQRILPAAARSQGAMPPRRAAADTAFRGRRRV